MQLINFYVNMEIIIFNSMKGYSRVQKKGLISSRNIQNSRLNSSNQNFDQLVEKQLDDDFKVHQYLNQNPNDGHNTQKYISLFNSLLVRKNNKIKKKQLLRSSKAQFESSDSRCQDSQSMSKVQLKNQKKDTYYTEQQYLKIKQESEVQQQIIQAKTDQQFQMRRILLKQITEKKKSIHLLKGDISHMIDRNEAISILQSKVNKVSLVSENQLKRVSLALTKDKQQVQLRKQMQKKFYNKLKIVENAQNKNLKKIKLSFIETMNRRKQIFDNLSLIQKQFQSIQYYSDKLKQKEQKNVKTIALFELLNSACNAIDNCLKQWNRFQNKQINHQEYSVLVRKIFKKASSEGNIEPNSNFSIDDVTQQVLEQISKKIIDEYKRLNYQVEQNKKDYNNYISAIQQGRQKITKTHKNKKQMIKQFTIDKRKELQSQNFNIEQYFKIVNKLQSNYNILYNLINFMNKYTHNLTDMELINEIYENQIFHFTINKNIHKFRTQINENLFIQIQTKIHEWFFLIKSNLSYTSKVPPHLKQQLLKFITLKNNQRINTLLKQYHQVDKENQGSLKNTQSDIMYQFNNNQQQNQDQLNPYEKNFAESNDLSSLHSIKREKQEEQIAKRVKILEDIDKSYYRMIKQTIQMEKQNTKKNYQFQKSFKRNKYSSQDELLQQKRFQASFSNLFKQDPDDLNNKSKDKNLQSKFAKVLSKSSKINRSTFSSMHNTNQIGKNSQSILKNNSGFLSTKGGSTHSNLWEKQKKLQLSVKLKDILSRV